MLTFGSVYAPKHGTAVRGRSALETFVRLGIRSHVASTEEPVPADVVRAIPGVDHVEVASRPPRYGVSWSVVRAARRAARDCDFVLLGSAVLLPAAVLGAPRLPIVWDANECETLFYGRLPATAANRVKRVVWFMLEWLAGRASRAVVSVSEGEARHWRAYFPWISRKLHVVAHAPGGAVPVAAGEGGGPTIPPESVLFVGSMVAKHNRAAAAWLFEELAPRLQPPWSVVIAGPGSDQLPAAETAGSRVRLLGAVADIDAVIARAAVCVAPLEAGAGVKTKVLQYLSVGRPVIGTPAAAEGLEGAPGLAVVELKDLAAAVLDFISAPPSTAALDALAASQRAWVEAHHGEKVVDEQWADVLRASKLLSA